jgi:hypothetical protein
MSTVAGRTRVDVNGGNVHPGSVRAVEYEIVSNQADIFGLTTGTLKNELRGLSELGVMPCVDDQSRKLTVIGDAKHVRRTLIANGMACDPDGMELTRQVFPVVLAGWQKSK